VDKADDIAARIVFADPHGAAGIGYAGLVKFTGR
jgi:hypothetical protein